MERKRRLQAKGAALMKASKYKVLDKEHEIFYWARGAMNNPYYAWSALNRPIYITGSQESFGWVISKKDTGVEMQYGKL